MRLLYIHQYFRTPDEPGGTRSYWVAKKFIDSGHTVTMITLASNQIADITEKKIDGIHVIYLKNNYSQDLDFVQKISSFLSYVFKVNRFIFQNRKNFDKIYATSTPLTVGIPALIAKIILNKPFIFEVRDLWPEAPIQLGVIKNRLLIWALKRFEKLIYVKAEKIVGLSPGMTQGVINSGIPNAKVYMVPNMSKPKEFFPRKKCNDTIKNFKIEVDKIVVLYFGSMGISNGLDQVLKFWHESDTKEFQLIFIGDGSEKINLENYSNSNKLNNVLFFEPQNMHIISELINCCDLSLISFKNLPILDTNSPNKLFDSLSAGKPLIINSKGWTKELLIKHDIGFYYNPNDIFTFQQMLKDIIKSKSRLSEQGENARTLALNSFDRDKLSSKIMNITT